MCVRCHRRRLYGCVLQLHDELLFEVRAEHLAAAAAIIRSVMEGAAAAWRLRVPLPVQLSVGRSWGELQRLRVDAPDGAGGD